MNKGKYIGMFALALVTGFLWCLYSNFAIHWFPVRGKTFGSQHPFDEESSIALGWVYIPLLLTFLGYMNIFGPYGKRDWWFALYSLFISMLINLVLFYSFHDFILNVH